MILNLYKYNNIINDLLTFTTVDNDDDDAAVRRHCRVIHCRRRTAGRSARGAHPAPRASSLYQTISTCTTDSVGVQYYGPKRINAVRLTAATNI